MFGTLAAILFAFGLVGPAAAQGIAEKAEEAEAFAGEGQFIEAIAALDEAASALWDEAPLTFRKALWVAEPPGGFGAYNPRETDVFDSGAEMIV